MKKQINKLVFVICLLLLIYLTGCKGSLDKLNFDNYRSQYYNEKLGCIDADGVEGLCDDIDSFIKWIQPNDLLPDYFGMRVGVKVDNAHCEFHFEEDVILGSYCYDQPIPNHNFTLFVPELNMYMYDGKCIFIKDSISVDDKGKPLMIADGNTQISECKIAISGKG